MSGRSVGFVQAAVLVAGPGLRHFLRSKAVLGVGAIVVFTAVLAFAIGSQSELSRAATLQIFQMFFLGNVIVPLVALIFGTAAIAGEREAGTLAFLFTRPVPRAAVVVGKGVAAVASALAAVALVYAATFVAIGAPQVAPGAALAALLLETAALTSIFVLLGALLQKSLYVGLAYIAIWEGLLGTATPASSASVSYHARNLLSEWSGLPSSFHGLAMPATAGESVLVLATVAVAAMVLASIWVLGREYGLRDRSRDE